VAGYDFDFELPEVMDAEGDPVVVKWVLQDQSLDFLRFDPEALRFTVTAGNTTDAHAGTYEVNLKISDKNPEFPFSSRHRFYV